MFHKLVTNFTLIFFVCTIQSCNLYKVDEELLIHHTIEYSNETIDIKSLDDYFLHNKSLYPSYQVLKTNTPTILENIKIIYQSKKFQDFTLFRFSNDSKNGFLEGETFLYCNENYYQLGCAFGGYGLTEFVILKNDINYYLYFLYSCGSGIHQTYLQILNLYSHEFYNIKELALESNQDYTFYVNNENQSIDLYQATIQPISHNDGFNTYLINKNDLAFCNINTMKTDKIENDSSDGIYYGSDHTLVLKDFKEPTCFEEGYSIVGCTECDEMDIKTILPIVECSYENGYCKWCKKQEKTTTDTNSIS